MKLKDNSEIILPFLKAGSFSGMDRLFISCGILVLKEVKRRKDTGDIELITQAKDGPERRRGWIKFKTKSRTKKEILYRWLQRQIGKDIETIYHSKFNFGGEKYGRS